MMGILVFVFSRENAKQLMIENDGLQKQMLQTERDTIDVITFLKKEDAIKDTHVCLLGSRLFLRECFYYYFP